ncbi:MAG TPA: adenosylcobalamin-dependent ribonucleoside-diphosphate reductase, partial [Nitrososphaerales archaeon]|nr:adenosylcobalamin-dependent ribonucleoside-diphosphate reductase [Nitrososphaerales archaeon]
MEADSIDDKVSENVEETSELEVQTAIELPKETLDYFNGDELRARVFYEKYALKDPNGVIVERTPQDMWGRVARELASVEASEEKRSEWRKKFYWLLENFRFVPGGRIMFGAGQPRRSTLLNCYFIPLKDDSLESIFDFCKEAGRTYSFGGGVGTDISILRPKGAPVNNSAVVSTGSVSFMELFSVTTGTIGQAGRRGALMITIHVDHPDVLDFIKVKRDLTRVTHANISVCITDKFMHAVENDEDFELSFDNEKAHVRKTVRALDLWDKLVSSAHASAEPGIIFWDNVKNESPTEYNGMEVHGFNPCSEQCLEDFGCCCLGNVNLTTFVVDEFSNRARLDWRNLEKAIRYATRFLDNVLDYNSDKHPLPQQTKASLWSRRIGVGFTGLADMLIKLNLKYDTVPAIKFVDKMLERIKNLCYDESTNLAKEKGPAPAFDSEKHLVRPFVSRLSPEIKEKIRVQGLRNSCLLTVPPVGSGAILAGTTSGIEPIFALSYVRRSKSLSGNEFKVYHPLVQEYMRRFNISSDAMLPETFVVSHKIKASSRVQMQGSIQKHIDSSISSTVNIPRETTVEEVKKIYFQAWRAGCKG